MDYSKLPPFVDLQNHSIVIIHFFDRSNKGRIGILYRSIEQRKNRYSLSIDPPLEEPLLSIVRSTIGRIRIIYRLIDDRKNLYYLSVYRALEESVLSIPIDTTTDAIPSPNRASSTIGRHHCEQQWLPSLIRCC